MGSNEVQRYSPLQQNEARALSPTGGRRSGSGNDLEDALSEKAVENTAHPSSPLSGCVNTYGHDDAEEATNAASVAILSSRFNVKGLSNLASYPNPMQKMAQRALLKARDAHSAICDPAPFQRLFPTTPREFSVGPRMLPPPAWKRQTGPAHTMRAPSYVLGQSRTLPEYRLAHTPETFSFSTLSTGPGAPQPLTAGPPGQRVFRPSTIGNEHHIGTKTRSVIHPQLSSRVREHQLPAADARLAVGHGRPIPVIASGGHGNDTGSIEHRSISELKADGRPMYMSRREQSIKKLWDTIFDTCPLTDIRKYYPAGLPHDYLERFGPGYGLPQSKYPLHRRTAQGPSVNELLEQQEALDRLFYAGTGMLGRSVDDVVKDLQYRRRSGAVTEPRCDGKSFSDPRQPPGLHANSKVTYPFIRVEDAMAEERSVHAEVLLNMAFATLITYVEEYDKDPGKRGWRSGFVTPDSSYVDDSDFENKSFFEKPDH
ncbi:hypothetical protein VTK73DRAFT_8936 [Phialemonium thermophilum]|uniref:Uncharacterized protein n=1 Tax=Phialemonium thermophilum TaxID=223376 RepID=A0ABR3Y6L9_9PEZI